MLRAVWLVVMSAPSVMLILIWFPQVLETAFSVNENDIGHYAWLPPLFSTRAPSCSERSRAVVIATKNHQARNHLKNKRISSHSDLMLLGGVLASTIAFLPLIHSPWGCGFFGVGLAYRRRRSSSRG